MKKERIITGSMLLVLTIFYTLMVRFYDYRAIGPLNSKVGFANINEQFHNFIGVHMSLYKITNYLGLILGLIAIIYVVIGLIELIKRKSLKKVDKEIYLMGAFYVIVILVFVLFEFLEINYRPILKDGALDASFPSTHIFVTMCICLSSILVNKKYFKPYKIINIAILVLMLTIMILRTISGVHWFTDIIGGLFIGGTLSYMFYFAKSSLKKAK